MYSDSLIDPSPPDTTLKDAPASDHSPVQPLELELPSDVNVTFRKPVVERYTLDELRDPEFLRMRCDDSSQLHV